MAIELFGFRIGKAEDEAKKAAQIPSFVQEQKDDGAVEIAPGGAYGTFVDLEGTAKSEAELISRYREMSMNAEVEAAVDDIVNEALVTDADASVVRIVMDDLKQSSRVKKRIEEEFDQILELLDFSNICYEIFRRWYVDGRLYYHIMIDIKNPREGIKELRYIDPRRIRKVRIPQKKQNSDSAKERNPTVPAYSEYYLYNPSGLAGAAHSQGVKISPDSVCYVNSGLLDNRNRMVLSYLHKAIKPLNQVRMLEDAVVIYRLSRAPERRIFYIDVGNLPKPKAEQYLRDIMIKHKNRLVYDASTGEVRDDRKFMTMLEDFWLPRREGARGTEITTLPGGQNLGEMTDVDYFRKKLYEALSVPISRLDPNGSFTLGRSNEITRDEVKFARFIGRLRHRFTMLFDHLMGIQLALKGVMSREEWYEMRSYIKYDFQKDNYFSELKDQEVLTSRLQLLNTISPYVGVYYTKEWVQKNVLRMSDDEIQKLGSEIEIDSADQMDQAVAANKSQPEMMPDDSSENVRQNAKKSAPFSESFDDGVVALTEDDKKLIENMSQVLESIEADEFIDISKIDLSDIDIDDKINSIKRGLKK
jgi:hypothetical protein